ncbi:MAG: hypothetical protein ACKV0T_05080 [Planctomycetales bacterium]
MRRHEHRRLWWISAVTLCGLLTGCQHARNRSLGVNSSPASEDQVAADDDPIDHPPRAEGPSELVWNRRAPRSAIRPSAPPSSTRGPQVINRGGMPHILPFDEPEDDLKDDEDEFDDASWEDEWSERDDRRGTDGNAFDDGAEPPPAPLVPVRSHPRLLPTPTVRTR